VHRCTLKSSYNLQDIAAGLPRQYPYLLDSAAAGPLCEYSLLLRANGEQLCKFSDGRITGPGEGDSFLSRLNDWFLREKKPVAGTDGIPYTGGWFVYLGYELAAEIEPTVQFPAADDGFPVAFASRCPAVILTTPDRPGELQLLAENPALLEQVRKEISGLTAIAGTAVPETPEMCSR